MNLAADILTLADFEAPARERIPHAAWEYLAGGAGDEITLRENALAFDRRRLRPRVLRDVSRLDTRVSLFGDTFPTPILLAPAAYLRTVHPEGELAAVRGAGAAGAGFIVSTGTNVAIEDLAAVAAAPLWFQMYVQTDRGFTRDLVARVETAGVRALCVTVDTPVLGVRPRQQRARFELPRDLPTPHLNDRNSGLRGVNTPGRVVVTWADIASLRDDTRIPLLLKGILNPDDAAQALELGVDGLIVSNHGGRNLDTLPATVDALPGVVERVAGAVPVLVDGGVRRGTDVLKCLALGASAVLLGRPYLHALGLAGADGVAHAVRLLHGELQFAMALTGRSGLAEVDATVLW